MRSTPCRAALVQLALCRASWIGLHRPLPWQICRCQPRSSSNSKRFAEGDHSKWPNKPKKQKILLGGIPTPLKNMKVSWDDEIPNIWKNKKVPNHQLEKECCARCQNLLPLLWDVKIVKTAKGHQGGFRIITWWIPLISSSRTELINAIRSLADIQQSSGPPGPNFQSFHMECWDGDSTSMEPGPCLHQFSENGDVEAMFLGIWICRANKIPQLVLPCFTMFYHVYQPWKWGATSWSVVHRTSKIILSNLACLWLSIWITVGLGMMKTIIPVTSEVNGFFVQNRNRWFTHLFLPPIRMDFPYISHIFLCLMFSPWKLSHIFLIYFLCSFLYFPYNSHIFPMFLSIFPI